MAIYSLSQTAVVKQARVLKTVRWWMIGISATGLAISLLLTFSSPGRLSSHISQELLRFLFIACFVILIQSVSPWGSVFRQAKEVQKQFCVEITSDEIEVRAGDYSRCLRRDEIVRAEESSPGRGLYLRTSNRYRWILIPRRIDGYQKIKDSLTSGGTPVVVAKVLPNWEDFLFIFFFLASPICDLATNNRSVLLVKLAVAVLFAVFGMIWAKNYSDNPKFMLSLRLGSMIPAVMALLAVLSPFGMF